MTLEISCGAVVYTKIDNAYKFLIIRNLLGKHYGFPKGHQENGEEFWETAVREVKEETGIDIEVKSTFYATNTYFVKEGVLKDVHYFLAEAKHTEIILQASEVAQAAFLSKKEVLNLITYQNDKEIFLQLTKDLV